jgi:uracil-DNA glycosylase
MNAQENLAQIASEVSACTRCALHKTRTKSVPGEGPEHAEIMCIGEGPGFNEDQQGRPFIGQAGKFLEELLGLAGLKRTEVWIGNVVKCRPPNNRDPMPEELVACNGYLERQMAALEPKIIITLGRFSMGKFMPTAKISAVHGQMRKIGDRFVIPMFHPAAALHNPTYLPLIKADFAKLPELLEVARKEASKATPPPQAAEPKPLYEVSQSDEPKQMKLF